MVWLKELFKFYLALLAIAGILFISILAGAIYQPLFLILLLLQLFGLLFITWKYKVEIQIGEDEHGKKGHNG